MFERCCSAQLLGWNCSPETAGDTQVQNNMHVQSTHFVVISVVLNNDGVGVYVTLDILLDRLPDRPGAFSA